VYVINPDTVENNRKVRQASGLSIPILLDPEYRVARMYDLPADGRPMRGLVGYVIMDRRGLIRVQRVDLDFGVHGPQIVETLRVIVAMYR
jgi:peroxiredoxin